MSMRRTFSVPGFGWQTPFTELERARRQMIELSDLVFRGSPSRYFTASGVYPLVNLTEDAGNYYLRTELSGLRSEDLDIQVAGRSLTISGERKIPTEGENVRYHRREREAGKFSRVMGMPGDIDAEKVEAKMTNGILSVTIPKSELAKPRQITVK